MEHFSGGGLDEFYIKYVYCVHVNFMIRPDVFRVCITHKIVPFQAWTLCCTTASSSSNDGCSAYGAIGIKTGFCHAIEKKGFRYYGMLYNKCMSAIESLGLKLVDRKIKQIYNQESTPGCFYDPDKQRGFYQLRLHQNSTCKSLT